MTTIEVSKQKETEFHRVYNNWIDNVNKILVEEFPISSTIFVVAAAFFGFFSFLTFSISAMICGTLLATLSVTSGIAIQRNFPKFWENLQKSVIEIKNFLLSKK